MEEHSIRQGGPVTEVASSTAMATLQNRWYNALTAALSADRQLGQILQPASVVERTDAALWSHENLRPPLSLTFNTRQRPTDGFFAGYAAIVRQLDFPMASLEREIGTPAFQAWTDYLGTLQPAPAPDDLPAAFLDWALRQAPSVANIGVSYLNSSALVIDAQKSLEPYLGPDAKTVDYADHIADVSQTLLLSTNDVELSFSSEDDSEVSDTWAKRQTDLYGLWTTPSGAASTVTGLFANSHVTVNAVLYSYTVWPVVPGPWYQSSLLHLALSNQDSPPWPPNANPTWLEAFGSGGFFRRAFGALLVVNGMKVSVTSDAILGEKDRDLVANQAEHGLWPFFVADACRVAENTVDFTDSGLRLTCEVVRGNPVIIGANVLDINRYVGQG